MKKDIIGRINKAASYDDGIKEVAYTDEDGIRYDKDGNRLNEFNMPIKTWICSNCGNKIEGVECNPIGFYDFIACGCNYLRLRLPYKYYNNEDDYKKLKCPICGKYPFKEKPESIMEEHKMIVTIGEISELK